MNNSVQHLTIYHEKVSASTNNAILTGNINLDLFIWGLIVSGIILAIPFIIATIVPFILKKPKKQLSIYIYAFITGMFFILGTFGYLREALEISSTKIVQQQYPIDPPQNLIYLVNIGCLVGGSIIGISIAFLVKFVISRKVNKKLLATGSAFVHHHDHDHHKGEQPHTHEHNELIFNKNDTIADDVDVKIKSKNKATALFLLLGHRIPEGILIGMAINMLVNLNNQTQALSVAFFISFVLHTIPEEIIFYYRQREMGISRFRSALNSALAIGLIIPFIFIGVYAYNFVDSQPWLQSVIQAIVGSIMVFTAFVEFIPEFYHTNLTGKKWIVTILLFFIGMVFTILILSFHLHR